MNGTTRPDSGGADRSQGAVAALLARSHRLGSDPAVTNVGGGNTSVKGVGIDPVTGEEIRLLWVKGSGGDIGTLTEEGLAVLQLDRVRALTGVFPGPDRDDEMVHALTYCLHGNGGAAPSIDTAMHALVDAPHVDHLHPDVGLALATAADGAALTRKCFGDRVHWVPWRRPGFQLALDVAEIQAANPGAIGCVLGGHGITAWGQTSEECEAHSLEIIRQAQDFLAEHGSPEPFGSVLDGYAPLPAAERRARAAALFPVIRGLVSGESHQIGHYCDLPDVLDFLSRTAHPRLAALGTSCPDHFLRTKVRPLLFDGPATAGNDEIAARLTQLHQEYRADYQAYYHRYADAESPPMRGADPAIVLVPGIGMFSFGKDVKTARLASAFYRNAIHAMEGAESVSCYAPIDESEKFRIEYWALEEAKLRRLPPPKPLSGRVALITGAGSGIGREITRHLAAQGACVVAADINTEAVADVAADCGDSGTAISVRLDVTDAGEIAEAFTDSVMAFGGIDIVVNNAGLSISKSLLETSEQDWDCQHDVMAKGSFLVSRESARIMMRQGVGGDLIYIVSKNAVVAGAANLAYGAAKADQAHQVRLLAAELGEHGIRVNAVNPDGVVHGSGIFSGGWGAQRAAVHGVDEAHLGEFYAQRTLLKHEVLPAHVADAVYALVAGRLSLTTGLHVPVDSGIPAAFLR